MGSITALIGGGLETTPAREFSVDARPSGATAGPGSPGNGAGSTSFAGCTKISPEATKPYEFIGFGAMEVTKPYEFIGFGAMEVTKPYEFIGFGAMDCLGTS